MYKTNDYTKIQVNDSKRMFILIGLVTLLVISLISGYFLSFIGVFEGTELGRMVFSLFTLSMIPVLVNYSYFVLNRIGLLKNRMLSIFAVYYTPGLLIHSGIYTIMIGLAFSHSLAVINYSTSCLILILFLGILWSIEYFFWFKKWPLYPKTGQNMIFLYWFHWTVLFGLLIGLPFHVRTWSLFWVSTFPTITFGTLFVIIFQEFRDRRTDTHRIGSPVI